MTVPPTQPPPRPPSDPDARLSPGDGGVIARVGRRTAVAGAVPVLAGVVLAATGWAWPGWFAGSAGAAVGVITVGLAAASAAALFRRARLWTAAEAEAAWWAGQWSPSAQTGADAWVKGVCGVPAPLHGGRGAIPMVRRARRLPAVVLPLRTVSGPLSAGYAVVVHARPDGVTPARGDQLVVRALQPRGPILIGRLDDGAVFAADRWSAATG